MSWRGVRRWKIYCGEYELDTNESDGDNFSNQTTGLLFDVMALKKPQNKSLLLTVLVAVAAYWGAQFSPYIGYVLALLTLILIGFYSHAAWPSSEKTENPYLFSLFWGLIIVLLLPFLATTFINEGIDGFIRIFEF